MPPSPPAEQPEPGAPPDPPVVETPPEPDAPLPPVPCAVDPAVVMPALPPSPLLGAGLAQPAKAAMAEQKSTAPNG